MVRRKRLFNMESINYQTLITARKLRQRTQKEVAAAIGVSQAKLSKAENGLQELPSEFMYRLADYYKLPLSFFYSSDCLTPVGHYYYRKKLTISDKVIDSFESKVQIIKSIIDTVMSNVELPEFTLTNYTPSDEISPVEIARKIRYELKLYRGPVSNLTAILENYGVIILKIDFGTDKIDGLTTVTASNRKVIFLNSQMPNDRTRFSLAHELGHLIMHIETPARSVEDAEREADEFASEFLMPADEITNDLNYVDFPSLAQLKKKWLVSMRALVRRARDLDVINANTYRNLQINFSKRGYTKNEPIMLPVEIPTLFKDTLTLYKEELEYSDTELQELMKIGEEDYKSWFMERPRFVLFRPQL